MANGWLCCVCLSLESQAAVLAIVSPYISKDGAASRLFTFPRSYKIYLACLFAAFLAGHTGSIGYSSPCHEQLLLRTTVAAQPAS